MSKSGKKSNPTKGARHGEVDVVEVESSASPARRNLLGLGLPAVAALMATACGSFRGSSSPTTDGKGDRAPNIGAGAGKNKTGEPDSKEGGPNATPTPGDNPTTLGNKPAPCDATSPGNVTIPPVGTPPAIGVAFKAYGDKRDTMVVAKAASGVLQAGDLLMLVRVTGPTTGKVLARRRVTSLDVDTRVVVFDGVQLGASAMTKLTAVVVRGGEMKRSADWDVKFETQISNPGVAGDMTVYEIVDAFSMRQQSSSGPYKYFGPHENYYDPAAPMSGGVNRTVCLAFGAPSAPTSGGGQGDKGVLGRAIKTATTASTWAMANGSYLPYNNAPNKAQGQDYYVCDAFGDPIPGLADGKVSGASNFLQKYSTIIVYVRDSDHFHRYFFNVG